VVEENDRLLRGCALLEQSDLPGFGRLMYRTHEGLRHEYEVSCAELDFLVDQAKHMPGVKGARMMGGGFGGCTINLVSQEAAAQFTTDICSRYEEAFGISPQVYLMQIEDGVKAIN